MQFVVIAHDGEGMLEKRMEIRPRHIAKIQEISDHVVCAGGLRDEEGNLNGSVLVLEYEDRAALDTYLTTEPYMVEHVWEKVDVEITTVVFLDKKMIGN